MDKKQIIVSLMFYPLASPHPPPFFFKLNSVFLVMKLEIMDAKGSHIWLLIRQMEK